MKKHLMIFILTFCCAVACAQNNPDIIAEKIPFKLFNNHIYLHVRNNSKPLSFILDTGAGDIIDLRQAQDLNLVLYAVQKTHGVGDSAENVALTNDVLFRVQDKTFTEGKIAVMALESVEGCINKIVVDTIGKVITQENIIGNAKEHQPIDGVLGSEFFKRFVVEINYEEQFLTLYNPKTYFYEGSGQVIPIDQTGHQIFTNAVVKLSDTSDVTGRFMIDTGFMLAVTLNKPFIEKNNLLPPSDETTPLDVCGIGGNSKARVGTVKSLLIQHVEINKPTVLFSQATGGVLSSTDFDGIIGNAIFRHFKVIFDYSRNQMILE